ncbi:MAG: hypothetical protein K6D59_05620 [Bacteroidales bacterium]|nr:hypothetical protein [Bacteroidales bacterium]
MPKEDTNIIAEPHQGATTLKEAIMGRLQLVLALEGWDCAKEKFNAMRQDFSLFSDWPDIEREVMEMFLKHRQQEQLIAAERQAMIDKALMEGLSKGLAAAQLNLLTGVDAQAPYYLTTSTTKKEQNDQRRIEGSAGSSDTSSAAGEHIDGQPLVGTLL